MAEMRKYGQTLDSVRLENYLLDLGVANESHQLFVEKSTHRDDRQHRHFLEKMISTIAEASKKSNTPASLVITNLDQWSTDEEDAAELYGRCWEKQIDLQVLETPWLNINFLKKEKVSLKAAVKMISALYIYERYKSQNLVVAKQMLMEKPVSVDHKHDHNKGRKLETAKALDSKSLIVEQSIYFNGTLKDPEMIEKLQISRNSYYKYKKELRQQLVAVRKKEGKESSK